MKDKINTFLRRFFEKPECASEFPSVDIETLDIIFKDSNTTEPIEFNKNTVISALYMSVYGVFCIISSRNTNSDDIIKNVKAVTEKFRLYSKGCYIFCITPNGQYYFDNGSLTEVDDACESMACLYTNLKIGKELLIYFDDMTITELMEDTLDINDVTSQSEIKSDGRFAPMVTERFLEDLEYIIETVRTEIENNTEKSFYYKDGIKYEKHAVGDKFLDVRLKEVYYPVASDDPNQFFYLALFGGMLGLHKFKARQIIQGLFYFFTLGGLGVLYFFDLLAIITGSYYVTQTYYSDDGSVVKKRKERIYIGKPTKPMPKFFMSLGLSAVVLLLSSMLYVTGMNRAALTASDYANKKIEETANEFENNNPENVFDEELNNINTNP